MNYHEETGTMFNDSMGKAAMEIMERSAETLKTGEMRDYPVFSDGRWEIRYMIGAPRRLANILQNGGGITDVSFGFCSFVTNGMPMVVSLLRFNNDRDLSYGMLASVDMLGKPGTAFQSLNYLQILGAQPSISYNLRGDGVNYSGEMKNILLQTPQFRMIQDAVSQYFSSARTYDSYQFQRASLTSQWEWEGMLSHGGGDATAEEVLGRSLWEVYEANMK